jgi:glycosyltransferase involved in cell wall biosynthesis
VVERNEAYECFSPACVDRTVQCPTLSDLPPPPPGKTGWPWTEESRRLPSQMSDGLLWPRISVVTPSLNQGKFIEETIRSVLLQGYPELEYIIIDGGSTDGSVEVIKKYEPWLTYWVSEPDRGQSHAINKGWQRACGEILAWLNSDDTYNPGAIRSAVEALRDNPAVGMVYSDMNYIDVSSNVIYRLRSQPYQFHKLLLDNYVTQSTVFVRREVLDAVGLLNETLHLIMDQELWLRIGRRNKVSYLSGAVLANLRIYPETTSNRLLVARYTEGLRLLDTVFADQTLPEAVRQLRRKEYGRCYMRLASALAAKERYDEVMPWLTRAVVTYPHQLWHERFLCIRLLAKALFGTSGVRAARALRRLVRERWQKIVGRVAHSTEL